MNDAQELELTQALALVALSELEDKCIIDAVHMETEMTLQEVDAFHVKLSRDNWNESAFLAARIEERLGNEDCKNLDDDGNPHFTDIQIQAMIHRIALDRMIGTFENYRLQGRTPEQFIKENEQLFKRYLHIVQAFADAQLAAIEIEQYHALFKLASPIVDEFSERAING